MASAQETNVSQKSQDGPIPELTVDSIIEFVAEIAKVVSKTERLQDFPYMANRSVDLLHGNKILKQILSEIASECDEQTAFVEMQWYMYRLVLWELFFKFSVANLSILELAFVVQKDYLGRMEYLARREYLVPYTEAIEHELQPEKIANELKSKFDEYTRCKIDGEAYLRSSDYKKAIQYYEKALAISTELGYQLGISKGYHNLAGVYFSMAQYEKAIEYFNECLTVGVKIGNQSGIAASNQNLGQAYFKLGKVEASIPYFGKSLDMYTKMETNQEGIALNNRNLGMAYFLLKEYWKSIDYLKKSLDMYTKMKNQEEIANSYKELGLVYFTSGRDETSIGYFKESLALYTKLEKWEGIASSSEYLGRVYGDLAGQRQKSIDYFKKSLDMYTKLEKWEEIAMSNEHLGTAYYNLEKNENAVDYYKKSLDMYTKLENQKGIANSSENLGKAYFNLEKYEECIDYSRKSLDMYTKLETRKGIANSNENLECMDYFRKSLDLDTELETQKGIAKSSAKVACAYSRLEKYEESIVYYKKSLDMNTKMENQEEMANSNKELGIIYHNLKKFEECIEYSKKSLDMYTKLSNWTGVAFSNEILGDVYLFIGQYEEASRYIKDSLTISTEMEARSGIAAANGALWRLFLTTNQYEKAVECAKKSIAINTEIGNQSEIAGANADLGVAYCSAGEYEKAITYLEIALKIRVSVNDKSGQAACYINLGVVYIGLQRYDKAIIYHKKALKISKEIGDLSIIACSNSNLGISYRNIEKFEKAIKYLEKARVIATKIGNQRELATINGNMGNVYLKMRPLDKAFECYKRGLALSDEIGNQSGIAYNTGHLGYIYVHSFKFEEAIPYYEKGLQISRLIRDRKFESGCLANLGECYYFIYLAQPRSGLEPLKQSISFLRKSIECSDSIFLNLSVDENQTSFTNGYVMSYFVLKCCFISLERFETALLVADLGKAKTLQISIEKRSNVADYTRKTWQAIDDEKEKDHISDIAKAIQLEENCATVLYYSFDLNDILNVWVLNCDQGNVNISIPINTLSRKDYIHTSVSKLLNTFNLTIDRGSSFFHTRHDVLEDDFKKLLLRESNPNNRVFQSETSARFEVKKQDLEKVAQGDDLVFEIEKKMSASKITENLKVDKANMNKGGTDNSEHLRNLFMALIHPIQEFIKGTKLIIIPDAFLFFAPFSAFLDENGVYLSEKYSIQITPSLHTLYSRMLASEPVSLGPALFVGNPTVGSVSFKGKTRKVSSLPFATEEVTLLASRFHAIPLTESEAIKSRVLNRISESSIIHIAAHGDNLRGEIFLAPNPGWKKSITLASNDAGGNTCALIGKLGQTTIELGFDLPTEEFYLLQERNIISRDIKARLVVLSSCFAGRGKISSEGVIGLARSFLAAGAQSVLVTFWKISDEGTKLFMEKFYDELLKEVSVCEALKTSMNVFQHHETCSYRQFSIWAPFTIFGKDVRFSRDDIEDIKWESHEISLQLKC